MEFRHDGFDVWVFRRSVLAPEYLLLRASKEKAERWFGGAQFWQIPSDFVGGRTVVDAISTELQHLGLAAKSAWAAEHTYTIYNRRYDAIVHLAVFAAQVDADEVRLGSGHDQYVWALADEVEKRVSFRGLKEGLHWVRRYVTEVNSLLPELRLA